MRKLLRPRDHLLVTIGLVGDVFEELKDPLEMQAHGCHYLYGWVPERWKRHHFKRAARRMLKTGDIEKAIVKGKPVLRLTSQGNEKWIREFPLFHLAQGRWDGLWRIVSFDIPEQLKGRRESLREKIERIGMGRLQESLYITPFDFGTDLQEFVQAHGLTDFVVVFEANHTFGEDSKALAWRVWKLKELQERYTKLLEQYRELESADARKKHALQVNYEQVLLEDPLLPRELLPDDWVGWEARKVIFN